MYNSASATRCREECDQECWFERCNVCEKAMQCVCNLRGKEERKRGGADTNEASLEIGMDATRAGASGFRRWRLSRHHGWPGLSRLPMMTTVPTSRRLFGYHSTFHDCVPFRRLLF